MKQRRLHDQLLRFLDGKCTAAELAELKEALKKQAPGNDEWLQNILDGVWEALEDDGLQDMDAKKREIIFQQIVHVPKREERIRTLIWWSAAALVLSLSVALYYFNFRSSARSPQLVHFSADTHADILPRRNNAVLILANGEEVVMDSIETGTAVYRDGIRITKNDGILICEPLVKDYHQFHYDIINDSKPRYNQFSTPKSGQYAIRLPDGTKVTLNASSWLTYPPAFSDDIRVVEFSGEGYFEVASEKGRPFVVRTDSPAGHQEVKVLGTEFNINTYDNHGAVTTTLVEGSVEVNGAGVDKGMLLKPGQQADFSSAGGTNYLTLKDDVDMMEITAWKDGLFVFNDQKLPDLLQRISRWYDVAFVYQQECGDIRFQGNYSKNKGLMNLLKNLEMTDKVEFKVDQSRINERRIYVIRKQ